METENVEMARRFMSMLPQFELVAYETLQRARGGMSFYFHSKRSNTVCHFSVKSKQIEAKWFMRNVQISQIPDFVRECRRRQGIENK